MKKSTLLISTGIATSAFLIGLTLSNPFASAFQNGDGKFSSETKGKIDQAILSGDYATWKTLTNGKGEMSEVITEANFPLLKDLQTAMKNGDTAKAQEIRKTLGLPEFGGKGGRGMGGRGMMENISPETRTKIDAAIEAGDFATWKTLTADHKGKMSEVITEANFPLLKELKAARKSGDTAKIAEIQKTLGLPGIGEKGGRGMGGRGMMENISPETRTKIDAAIEAGDYATWKTLTADHKGKMSEVITEANFPLLKELNAARKSGDTAKIAEIQKTLGLSEMGKMGHGRHGDRDDNKNVTPAATN